MVPREYTTGTDLPPGIPAPFWITTLTSMFLHGGWMHLGGNMLYLWIFGDNLEKVMGHLRFLLFYLICGVAAAAAHILFNPNSVVPTVGRRARSAASSAAIWCSSHAPVARAHRGGVAHVPALLVLGFWILIQFINGVGSVVNTPETGGVAYLAHIGGFVAGLVLVKLFAAGPRTAQGRARLTRGGIDRSSPCGTSSGSEQKGLA